MLEVKGLKKTFKMSKKQQKIEKTKEKIKVAVADVSFDARPGEILGILGANGAGKTTTLRILASVIKADEGQVCLDGADITGNLMDYRRHIGFLTSELKLEDYFTPNYLFDYFSKLYGVGEEQAAQRKKELFEKFGIDKFAEVKVADMSTGMKQKISLVISIVHNPDIIIFDEPTNGLDIPGKSQFRKFIASGMSDDKTIVISTHQVRDIDKVLDHVLIMDDSRVLLDESTSNICDKLFFVESDDRELAKSALFAIPTIQGNYLILPNEKQDESELNLELLFNATLATPEEIARLFHTQK